MKFKALTSSWSELNIKDMLGNEDLQPWLNERIKAIKELYFAF